MTYGYDVVLIVEIYLKSIRIQRKIDISSEHFWSMMLDELIDLDEKRLVALYVSIRQKEQVAKAHNKKVKVKTFSSGDYVWKVSLPMDQRDKTLGKWSHNWKGLFRIIQVFSNNAYEIEELTLDHRIPRVNGKYLKKYKPMLHEIRVLTE